MKKIKIVFIIGTLDVGGTEKQILELLQRLNRDRFEAYVLAFRTHGKLREQFEARQIPFTGLGFSAPKGRWHPESYHRLFKLFWQIVAYLKRVQPHIVHTYLPWANICGAFAAKIAGVPVVITGRRASVSTRFVPFPRPDQWLQNLSNLLATVVISNSQIVRQECLTEERFLPSQKIRVIYNGVDSTRYHGNYSPTLLRQELGISSNHSVVGKVATLHPRKGHQILLQAAQTILRHSPHTTFVITGRDTGIRADLERLARQLHIEDSVIFTGERHDIPEIISLFDVQVSCSYVEGMSNAILEGMASKKPIIAANLSGNPELVVDGRTGFLIPAGNHERLAEAIIQLLDSPRLRQQMGQAGQQRVQDFFQIERMVEQTERLYLELVSSLK